MKLNKLVFTAMAVLAVVVQPLYAVVASQGASALAAGVVTNVNPDGWSWGGSAYPAGVPGTAVIMANSSTGGNGALLLDTPANESWIWTIKDVADPLASVTALSYMSQRVAGSAHAAPGLLLYIDADGDTSTDDGFYIFYEPVYNYPVASTNYGDWNTWNINTTSSKFWSGTVIGGLGGANGANMFTLDHVKTTYPNAIVGAYQLNMGTGNTGWTAWTDKIAVNGVVIADFELEEVVTDVTTGAIYEDLQSAVDAASAGDELRINQDIALTDDVDITKRLTIDGNGRTITANFVKTGNDNNSALSVFANDVTIKNLILDGVNPVANQLHGINAHQVTDLLVDGVTARNFRTGILYNGSTGTIQNVHTQNNIWHGINIDKDGANVDVIGNNTHTEDFNIYVDDDTKNVTVYAPAYGWSRSGIEGRDNDRVYRKKVVVNPEVPVIPETPTNPASPQGNGGDSGSNVAGTNNNTVAEDFIVIAAAEGTNTINEDDDSSEVLGTEQGENGTLSAQDSKDDSQWALVNVLLAGLAVTMSVAALAGVRGSEGIGKWLRVLTLIPAIGAIVTVLVVEDFTAKLGWVNGWTLLFGLIVIAQAILMVSAKADEE